MRLVTCLFLGITASIAIGQVAVRPAPELTGSEWINTDKPISLTERKGKVTIVHFWTFECANCHANLAAYDRLLNKYGRLGVEMVGIHTPELPQERSSENVRRAITELKIKFPVLIDPAGKNWAAFHVDCWPTVFVVDRKGNIRYTWEGEFAYRGQRGEQEVSRWIDLLLKEPG